MKHPKIKYIDWIKYNLSFIAQHFFGTLKSNSSFLKLKNKANIETFKNLELINYNPSASFLETDSLNYDYFIKNRSKPIVFRGVAKKWDCCVNWDFNFFKLNYGNTEVLLNNNEGLIDKNNPQKFEKLLLKDYVDSVENGSRKYLKFTRDIINSNPELKNDIALEELRKMWLPNSIREEIVMFMSGAGTLTPIHAAPSSNFFIQVSGKKTWTVYPSYDRMFLDVKSNRSYYYFSDLDPTINDTEKFPLSKFAEKYTTTLEAGDVLWVPPFAWHHVYNPTPSIGISYRFLNLKEAFKNSSTLMSLIFFATKPNPLTHLYYSIFKKQTVIFTEKYNKTKA